MRIETFHKLLPPVQPTVSPPVSLPHSLVYSDCTKWYCLVQCEHQMLIFKVQPPLKSHPYHDLMLTSHVFSEQSSDFHDNLQQAVKVN